MTADRPGEAGLAPPARSNGIVSISASRLDAPDPDALRRLVDRADFAGRRIELALGQVDERIARAEAAVRELHEALELAAQMAEALRRG